MRKLRNLLCVFLSAVLFLGSLNLTVFAEEDLPPEPAELLVTNIRASSVASNEGTGYALALLDDNVATHWHDVYSNTSAAYGKQNDAKAGHYIDIDLGSPQEVTSLKLFARSNGANFPDTIKIYVPAAETLSDGWVNGSASTAAKAEVPTWANADSMALWSEVTAEHTEADTPKGAELTLGESQTTRYIRVFVQLTSSVNIALSGIEVFGFAPENAVEAVKISGVRATHVRSGEGSGIAAMIDGQAGTFWQSDWGSGSSNPVIEIDLGAIQEVAWVEIDKAYNNQNKAFTKVSLASNTNPEDYWTTASGTTIVQGDNDGQVWSPVTAVNGGLLAGEKAFVHTATMRMDVNLETRYLRIAPGTVDSGANDLAISEIRVFGKELNPEPEITLTGTADAPENDLALWYREPGKDNGFNISQDWLPIGNGKLAAMVGGDIMSESIQLNEESLWSGGPGGKEQDSNRADSANVYNYGYNNTAVNQSAIYDALEPIKGTNSPGSVTAGGASIASQLQGNYSGYGKYKNFGFLNLDYEFPRGTTEVKNYRRELDLEDGAARVRYEIGDTTYTREYIASYPDNVIAVRLSAEGGEGKVNLGVSVTPGQTAGKAAAPAMTAENGVITLTGDLKDNGLRYSGVWKVVNEGGSMATSAESKEVTVSDASAVTVYFSAATDYKNEYTKSGDGYGTATAYGAGNNETAFQMTYRTGETLDQVKDKVTNVVNTTAADGFESFLADHETDYKELFSRVDFEIGGSNDTPTDTALTAYKTDTTTPSARMLETILYQYGRYLLIASSREGSLPANLQGKWNNSNEPPWSADYHYNINLQMNYWPAGAGNLLETMEPLQKMIESLRVTGRYTAQKYSYPSTTAADAWKQTDGSAGWTMHVSGNIYGLTTPGYSWNWGWSPANNASLSQNLYQYLQYGGDKELFESEYWPIIREAAVMWTKALYKPETGKYAGKYVVVPSYSPEHGPMTIATAYDQQLVHDLFTLTLDCIDQLDPEDPLKDTIEEILENYYPVAEVGTAGTLKEWSAYDSNQGVPSAQGEDTHRHMSHMIGYYPGTSVSKNEDPAIIEAALKTLETRGLGATGWSMGWKINLWARAKDPENTYQLINNLMTGSMAKNLFDQHYPQGFQIDGNFGYTAGIHEMLLQNYKDNDTLELLPTLPEAWADGSIKGIRSIGGHEVDIEWADGTLKSTALTASDDGEIRVQNEIFADKVVKVNDTLVTAEDGVVTVQAAAGETYVISIAAPVDKQALQELVDSVKDFQAETYTPKSYAVFQPALAAAQAVLAKQEATQEEVNSAVSVLQQATDQLAVRADMDELNALLDTAATKVENAYTSESWSAFAEALTNAEAVSNDGNAAQEAVNAAASALSEAMDALAEVDDVTVDKQALQELVDSVKDFQAETYTPDSYAEFQPVLAAAQAVLANPEATQEAVNTAASELQQAKEQLAARADMDELNALLDTAATKVKEAYTSESWSAFAEALTNAEAVSNDGNATQEAVNAAVSALSEAMDALTRIQGEEINSEKLEQVIAELEQLDEKAYTADSWEQLQTALTAAKEVLNNPEVTQAEIDAQVAALQQAKDALVKKSTDGGKDDGSKDNGSKGNSTNVNGGKKSPATGDSQKAGLYVVVLILSLAAVLYVIKKRKMTIR